MAQKKSPEGIQYSGFFDALVKIPRQEGIMAMYKVPSPQPASLPTCYDKAFMQPERCQRTIYPTASSPPAMKPLHPTTGLTQRSSR